MRSALGEKQPMRLVTTHLIQVLCIVSSSAGELQAPETRWHILATESRCGNDCLLQPGVTHPPPFEGGSGALSEMHFTLMDGRVKCLLPVNPV